MHGMRKLSDLSDFDAPQNQSFMRKVSDLDELDGPEDLGGNGDAQEAGTPVTAHDGTPVRPAPAAPAAPVAQAAVTAVAVPVATKSIAGAPRIISTRPVQYSPISGSTMYSRGPILGMPQRQMYRATGIASGAGAASAPAANPKGFVSRQVVGPTSRTPMRAAPVAASAYQAYNLSARGALVTAQRPGSFVPAAVVRQPSWSTRPIAASSIRSASVNAPPAGQIQTSATGAATTPAVPRGNVVRVEPQRVGGYGTLPPYTLSTSMNTSAGGYATARPSYGAPRGSVQAPVSATTFRSPLGTTTRMMLSPR
mmetsp:Transcript_69520/g.159733  ORF Transcript_69520/g.159733 Transcript_69520/m.159733 type:complete len:310 (-) Transcript_69520:101-1030(-)